MQASATHQFIGRHHFPPAGVFAGLWKNARKVGADPDDLYTKRAATIGGKRAYEYFLTDSFRRVAEQAAQGSL